MQCLLPALPPSDPIVPIEVENTLPSPLVFKSVWIQALFRSL